MAMGMNMWNQMNNNNSVQTQSTTLTEISMEDKLVKIKNLLDKWLIDESDYKKKKDEILASM